MVIIQLTAIGCYGQKKIEMDTNLTQQVKLDNVDVIYYRTADVPNFFKSFYKLHSYRDFCMADNGGYYSTSDLYMKDDVPHEQIIFHSYVNNKQHYLIYYKSGPKKMNLCTIVSNDSHQKRMRYITLSFDSKIVEFGSFKDAFENNLYKIVSVK